MKKIIAFIIGILFIAVPAVAADYLYVGGNYSNTLARGMMSHAIGGNISILGDYGGAKRIYTSIGFVGDVSSNRDLNTDELKKVGIDGINTRFFSIPIRIGYPSLFNIDENMQFVFIPSLAMDMHFFRANFSQKIPVYGFFYNVEYKLSGWGYSIGLAADVGMQHKINKVYLRYGVDFDMRLATLLLADIKYTGAIKGSSSSVITESIADYFALTSTLYIAAGFKIRG